MDPKNVYEDAIRASSYATLEFPGTYYLAYRDLPGLLSEHVRGTRAIDFGCGTGRSTRFLKRLGFDVVGVEISPHMIEHAHALDAHGDYRLIEEGGLRRFPPDAWDLVLSAFTFDSIPSRDEKASIMGEIAALLCATGTLVNLVSSPEIYVNEWASFSTKDFPENRTARSGDRVRIIMTDVPDRRPVEDVVCSDDDYRKIYERAGLELVKTHKPLGRIDEAYAWVNERRIAPWVIYVLEKARNAGPWASEPGRGFGDRCPRGSGSRL